MGSYSPLASTDVTELLKLLTLEEKVSLLSGADGWQTQCIERLGIGSVKTTDGPAGARGKLSVDGPRAAFLPAPVLQAATWSKADLKTIGRLLCREAKTKTSQVLLAPTICCARNPLGGRNFESFSEDPILSGSLAIQYVSGLQETGEVVATAKHFVANEQEWQRFTINANIDEATLREIYLRPFEMLIKSATPPGCIMTAYNCVNGLHMDYNTKIIKDILRNEWGFQGLVMSDWGGTNSITESVIAGCDLEMPGPPERRGRRLLRAVANKSSAELEAAIDESCHRVLSLAKRMKLLGLSAADARATRNCEEISSTTKDDLRTLRKIAANGHVLLKNSAVLPLEAQRLQGKKVAFIGPNAKFGTAGGGGSASMNPQYQSQPMDAFKTLATELGIDVTVDYARGSYTSKWLPLTLPTQWTVSVPDGAEPSMLRLDFYATEDYSGPIIETQYRNSSHVDLFDSGPASIREAGKPYSLRLTSIVTPTISGKHSFSISSVGNARLWINGELLIDNYNWTEIGETFYSYGSVEVCQVLDMIAGQNYNVVLEAASKTVQVSPDSDEFDPIHVFGVQPSVRIGFLEELPDNLISEAVALSNQSDFTVLVLGLNEEWESEGYDRQTMALPGTQDNLVYALLDNSPHPEKIIVVNQSGSQVEMPWADRASTILQAWYGGQETGHALADVLLGQVNPSGHLPISWPRKYSDLHFAKDPKSWPGVEGQVDYIEGTNVGYRWYQKTGIEPQWWFGHGLSYTTFATSDWQVVEQPSAWNISVHVENTGPYLGQYVIQLYSWQTEDAKALRAFEKTAELQPGENETVHLQVQLRDMAHWVDNRWVLEKGDYYLGLGQHAGDDSMLKKLVSVKEEMEWQP